MPLRRSATRISWADSYTFAKTERPSLVSPTPVPRVEDLKAAWAVVGSRAALVAHQEVHLELEAGRSMLPTFVPTYRY